MASVYPKFVCATCDIELHCLVNPVTCAQCGGTLLVEDDRPEPDIPLGLYYWSQEQKERATRAAIERGIRQFEDLLAGVDDGSQDQEENLS